MINENDFFSGIDAIKSLRSSGYRNTASAIGELIDNSIQAEADEVHVVITTKVNEGIRKTKRVDEIAVIDNGIGMDASLLRQALKLGFGTNHNRARGMGKFGMGLPQASISQAKKIDVWSWTEGGVSSAKRAFIDLDDDLWMENHIIEEPDSKPIPDLYRNIVKDFTSGTIVKWSHLDKIDWKKPDMVFNRIENIIGRMYRYWLIENKVRIILDVYDSFGKHIESHDFRPLDPLFLNENAKCGTESPEKPLFKEYDTINRYYILPTDEGDKTVSVLMRFSIAKDEVRLRDDDKVAGFTDYGKLANECIGVSIVREGRELELNRDWNIPDLKDPRHRWWGAEICFSRDLDDVFGVTNNKQSASRLNEFCKKTFEQFLAEYDLEDSKDEELDLEKLKTAYPADYILADVITTVQKRIRDMYSLIESKTKKEAHKKAQRYGNDTTQSGYDQMAGKRSNSPETRSETDKRTEEIEKNGGNRLDEVSKVLDQDPNISEEDKDIIKTDVSNQHRCSLLVAPGDTSSFFGVSRKDTQVVVTFYNDHPMYDRTFKLFEDILSGNSVEDKEVSVRQAYDAMKLLFSAWARMEDEDADPEAKKRYRRLREKWGDILSDCYEE